MCKINKYHILKHFKRSFALWDCSLIIYAHGGGGGKWGWRWEMGMEGGDGGWEWD